MSLDWLLIVVALITGLMVAGAVIRTEAAGPRDAFGAMPGGLRTLDATETLIVFEDYSFNAGGWVGQEINTRYVGLGGILGPFGLAGAIERDLTFPEGTVRAVIGLDIISIDDWALDPLEIEINDVSVLLQTFSSRPDQDADMTSSAVSRGGVLVEARFLDAGSERGFLGGDPALHEQILRVEIAVTSPGSTLTLRVRCAGSEGTNQPEETGDRLGPFWAIDNLSVIAQALP